MNCEDCQNFELNHAQPFLYAGTYECINYKPKAPEFKEGDWAYLNNHNELVEVKEKLLTNSYHVVNAKQEIYIAYGGNMRFPEPADWQVEIDGAKYRAFADNKGNVHVYSIILGAGCFNDDGEYYEIPQEWQRLFVKLAGIPIMPFELSHGKFDYPI